MVRGSERGLYYVGHITMVDNKCLHLPLKLLVVFLLEGGKVLLRASQKQVLFFRLAIEKSYDQSVTLANILYIIVRKLGIVFLILELGCLKYMYWL